VTCPSSGTIKWNSNYGNQSTFSMANFAFSLKHLAQSQSAEKRGTILDSSKSQCYSLVSVSIPILWLRMQYIEWSFDYHALHQNLKAFLQGFTVYHQVYTFVQFLFKFLNITVFHLIAILLSFLKRVSTFTF
jgi:hypothetical protein